MTIATGKLGGTGIEWSKLWQAYRTFKANPAEGVLLVLEAERHSSWKAWVQRRLKRQAVHLESKRVKIDLKELIELPSDTLGGAYARHMIAQGFSPETFVTEDDNDDWLAQRVGLSHDIFHIITGFNATPIGEFGVAAFVLVQWWDMVNVFVMSWYPLYLLSEINKAPGYIASIAHGILMGLQTKPIITYAFEDNWDKPLVLVRKELGIMVK
jgi:ubiquinone biosynthesis protein Coq4